MKIRNKFILFLLFLPLNLLADGLSPLERQISNYIVEKKEEQLIFLEKLVNINSGTGNIEGVKTIGELLRPEFAALGFKTYWVEEPVDMHRAGTLIAERRGHSQLC